VALSSLLASKVNTFPFSLYNRHQHGMELETIEIFSLLLFSLRALAFPQLCLLATACKLIKT
jgi:hypothetical protein